MPHILLLFPLTLTLIRGKSSQSDAASALALEGASARTAALPCSISCHMLISEDETRRGPDGVRDGDGSMHLRT